MLRTLKSDIEIIKERDPAARGIIEIFLCYPGFQSIVIHRFTHKLWQLKIPLIPRLLSHLNRLATGIEIHPGAKIGRRVFICLLYTSPSPRDEKVSRMPSSA